MWHRILDWGGLVIMLAILIVIMYLITTASTRMLFGLGILVLLVAFYFMQTN